VQFTRFKSAGYWKSLLIAITEQHTIASASNTSSSRFIAVSSEGTHPTFRPCVSSY
jgi:hypothetical protein